MNIQYELIAGQRRGSQVLVDNINHFIYQKSGLGYRCHLYPLLYCTARINVPSIGEYVEHGSHGHHSDPQLLKEYRFINECKHRASNEAGSFREIFNSVLQTFPDVRVTFPSIERSMLRARRVNQPPVPQSIEECIQLLENNERYRMNHAGTRLLFRDSVTTQTGKALVFVSADTVSALIDSAEILIDGTFRCVPGLFKQMVTIHAVKNEQVFPVAYALLNNKRQDLYEAVLRKVVEVATAANGQEPNPELVISDFELAIINASEAVFPNARFQGCFFHFGQSIYRKACKLGLQIPFLTSDGVQTVVRMLIALALAPPDMIHQAMTIIREQSAELVAAENEAIRTRITRLLAYFQNYWITSVGPSRFSVSHADRRTNNSVESFHMKVNALLSRRRQTFFSFIESLQSLEAAEAHDFRLAMVGERIRRNRRTQYHNQDILMAENLQLLQQSRVTLKEYLTMSSTLFALLSTGRIMERRRGLRRPRTGQELRNVRARLGDIATGHGGIRYIERELRIAENQRHQLGTNEDVHEPRNEIDNAPPVSLQLPAGVLGQENNYLDTVDNLPVEVVNQPLENRQRDVVPYIEPRSTSENTLSLGNIFQRYSLQRSATVGTESIQSANSNICCSICLDRPVTDVMVPCGHCFCFDCSAVISYCGLCRQFISRKVRFFL